MEVEVHDALDGQVALVTGASRGIGLEIARRLGSLGATVYAGARDPDAIANEDHRPIGLDVTDEREVRDAVERIDDETGRLDVLVNNAGIGGPRGSVDQAPTAGIDRTLETNLRGPIVLCKHAVEVLLRRRGGRIVNVSSRAGQIPPGVTEDRAIYCISKAGLNALTVHLHDAYADQGLIANAVSPGWVRTELGGERAPRSPAEGADTPVWLARFAPGAPGGKFWHDREVIDW